MFFFNIYNLVCPLFLYFVMCCSWQVRSALICSLLFYSLSVLLYSVSFSVLFFIVLYCVLFQSPCPSNSHLPFTFLKLIFWEGYFLVFYRFAFTISLINFLITFAVLECFCEEAWNFTENGWNSHLQFLVLAILMFFSSYANTRAK